MKPLYRITRSIFKLYFKIFHRHSTYGLENFMKGRAILAPNHTSFFDPPLVAISWPGEVSFLARKTLFASPIFGTLITRLNAYPVNQASQELSSMKLICQLLGEDKNMVIFPEGKRSSDGSLLPIKSGIGMLAMRAQSPIIPVYIHGGFYVWNRFQRFPKLSGKTACVFGAPIDWHDFSHLDKKAAQEAIANKVRESILELKSWYQENHC